MLRLGIFERQPKLVGHSLRYKRVTNLTISGTVNKTFVYFLAVKNLSFRHKMIFLTLGAVIKLNINEKIENVALKRIAGILNLCK